METVRLDTDLAQSTAPNGLTVLSERLPSLRSAAVGIWVRTASVHETRPKMGVSHMLEHMVFKGTERRTARQLALELEVRGGSLDAYTGRDHTNYQAHLLDEDLPLAVEILTDLVRRPLLREADLQPERNVVLEEINGVLDTPDDLVFELHAETLWPDHPYGYSILGTPESVAGLKASDLRAVHAAGYYPANCVIAAAGNVDHQALLAMLEREGWFDGGASRPLRAETTVTPARHGIARSEPRESAQVHLVFGSETFRYRDPRRYALAMLTNALGGGMSSRLFQRVREELGLAYGVYAFQQFYQSTGVLGIYVGTAAATADAAVDAIRDELGQVAREGLPDAELLDAKRQLKGQVTLSLESPLSRMNRLAGLALYGEPYRPLSQVLAEIDGVTSDTIAQLAAEYFAPARQTMVRLGPPA